MRVPDMVSLSVSLCPSDPRLSVSLQGTGAAGEDAG